MVNKVYLFEELMHQDVSLLGRYEFLNKYGKEEEPYYDKVTGEYIRHITAESICNTKEWKKKEELMGRVKDWLLDMEEDAAHLTLDEWSAKHGSYRKEIWDKIHGETKGQFEMDIDWWGKDRIERNE